jgi:rhodanese-related sulfurtransferase
MEQLIEFSNAHPLLVAGTILMALAVIFYELRMKARGLTAISTVQAVRLINQGARVVDIRDKAEFDAGHIVNAIHIPAAALDGEGDKRLKNGKSIILVCDNGSKSSQCIGPMKKNGRENIFSLQGGLTSWRQENLPVVTSEGKS